MNRIARSLVVSSMLLAAACRDAPRRGRPCSCDAGASDAASLVCSGSIDRSLAIVCVDGTFDVCPVITNVTVLPTAVLAGATIDVYAEGTDADGDSLSFDWSSSSGHFHDRRADATKYECRFAGRHALELALSDGACTTRQVVEVECVLP